MDCFYVGRLQGTKGAVWQYTAIDVGSAYCWAELRAGSVKHSESRWTSVLARRVAADLAARDWTFEAVMTDHGTEFAGEFTATLGRARSRTPPHRRRSTPDQQLRRTGATNHPRRVLETGVRSTPTAQHHRSARRTPPLPPLLQHRPSTHRPLDPRPNPRTSHRESQDVGALTAEERRHHSERGQASSRTDGRCLHPGSLVIGDRDGRTRAATEGAASSGGAPPR